MRIIAGIVLFNPEIKRLRENLDAIHGQVDKVLLVDNASENVEEVEMFLKEYANAYLIKNEKNEGIAYALNQILRFAQKEKAEWFITLDQDSVCKQDLVTVYRKYTKIENVAMMTCQIRDRNFTERKRTGEQKEYNFVTYCITSGSFVNTRLCKECGGWDERLFIDNVDGDICINFKIHGYRVLCINYEGLLHEVGQGRNVHFLWVKGCVYNHPPFRHYFIARNHIYVARKYPGEYRLIDEIKRELRSISQILLFEKEKKAKMAARMKGVKDGLRMGIEGENIHG